MNYSITSTVNGPLFLKKTLNVACLCEQEINICLKIYNRQLLFIQ